MLRLTIHTTLSSRSGSPSNIWFPFEIDAPDIEAVYQRIARDGCIFGQRVTTETDGSGNRVAVKREPYILALGAIATVGPCHFEYFEPSEVVA